MIVTTTLGSMFGDCAASGLITEEKRRELDVSMHETVELTPLKKIQDFKHRTGYSVNVNGSLGQTDWGTRITISDENEQAQPEEVKKSIRGVRSSDIGSVLYGRNIISAWAKGMIDRHVNYGEFQQIKDLLLGVSISISYNHRESSWSIYGSNLGPEKDSVEKRSKCNSIW